ncbi:MAG: hypothetical protein NTZ51_10985 [Proteobacteria bacterium]|nr:hypothetical protein [Pseudomonadota bacterium]
MIKKFNEMTDSADSGDKSAVRALQAWQYLIAKAANRQIVQYEELRVLMDYPTSNPLASILGCIMFSGSNRGQPQIIIDNCIVRG